MSWFHFSRKTLHSLQMLICSLNNTYWTSAKQRCAKMEISTAYTNVHWFALADVMLQTNKIAIFLRRSKYRSFCVTIWEQTTFQQSIQYVHLCCIGQDFPYFASQCHNLIFLFFFYRPHEWRPKLRNNEIQALYLSKAIDNISPHTKFEPKNWMNPEWQWKPSKKDINEFSSTSINTLSILFRTSLNTLLNFLSHDSSVAQVLWDFLRKSISVVHAEHSSASWCFVLSSNLPTKIRICWNHFFYCVSSFWIVRNDFHSGEGKGSPSRVILFNSSRKLLFYSQNFERDKLQTVDSYAYSN